jgi:hypothetical protein
MDEKGRVWRVLGMKSEEINWWKLDENVSRRLIAFLELIRAITIGNSHCASKVIDELGFHPDRIRMVFQLPNVPSNFRADFLSLYTVPLFPSLFSYYSYFTKHFHMFSFLFSNLRSLLVLLSK